MEGSFDFKLSDGRTCTLKAKYECIMKDETINLDGDILPAGKKPTTAGRCNLVAYIDGEQFDSCWNDAFWRLIDVNNGKHKKIWGLKVGFANMDDAERYERWIEGIIEGGKSQEVKDYEREQAAKEAREKVEAAKAVIKKAEKQRDIPTAEEARKRMKQWNDIYNEGGEGFVPHIISVEEYNRAKEIVAEYDITQ